MIISDLTELNTIDSACYMPIDVSGDAKKIQASLLTSNIANNLTTTDDGYVLDAVQGKALNDNITVNAEAIADMETSITARTFYKSQPWALYTERSGNNTTLYYPSDANEIMIVTWENSIEEYFSAVYIPGMTSDALQLFLGGYYQGTIWYSARFITLWVTINPSDNSVGSITGFIKPTTADNSAAQINTSSNWSTQIWYR